MPLCSRIMELVADVKRKISESWFNIKCLF